MPYDPEEMTKQQLTNMETDADLGVVSLPRISAQQRYYVAARVGGMGITAASLEAGAEIRMGHRPMGKAP